MNNIVIVQGKTSWGEKKKLLDKIIDRYKITECFTIDELEQNMQAELKKLKDKFYNGLKQYITKTINYDVERKKLTKIVNGVYTKANDILSVDVESFLNAYLGEGRWEYNGYSLARISGITNQVFPQKYGVISSKRISKDKQEFILKLYGLNYKYVVDLELAKEKILTELISYVDPYENDDINFLLKKAKDLRMEYSLFYLLNKTSSSERREAFMKSEKIFLKNLM